MPRKTRRSSGRTTMKRKLTRGKTKVKRKVSSLKRRAGFGRARRSSSKSLMSVAEAGRRGGEITASRYGHDFYQEIGRKGGRKGGQTTKQRYGPEFFEMIGRKGGQKVRELIKKGRSR